MAQKPRPSIEATRAQHPDLSPYQQRATSYAGTILWDFLPKYRLSVSLSHNERLPSPMELYYNGKHLATNSFEYGNKNLTKEKSNNLELGLSYRGDKWRYRVSGYYSDFDNYIFKENIAKFGNLYIRRYNQTTAKIYGAEGDISYDIIPKQSISLRGKIGALTPVVGKNFYNETPVLDEDNINAECLLQGGELNRCVQFLNQPIAPPKVEFDPVCMQEYILAAPDICVLTYPAQVGTDVLECPAKCPTYAAYAFGRALSL